MILINFKKLHEDAIPFTYTREKDACMDMYALEDTYIIPNETKIIKTGIAVELPKHFEGVVRGRSGLSSKGILIHIGTIDEEYRGDIGVIITNVGYGLNASGNFFIKKGDRIGQFTIKPVYRVHFVETNELSNTSRGNNGYGSSGIK